MNQVNKEEEARRFQVDLLNRFSETVAKKYADERLKVDQWRKEHPLSIVSVNLHEIIAGEASKLTWGEFGWGYRPKDPKKGGILMVDDSRAVYHDADYI